MSKEAQIAKHNAKLMRRAVAEKHRVEMAGAHKADTAQWQSKNIGDLSLLDGDMSDPTYTSPRWQRQSMLGGFLRTNKPGTKHYVPVITINLNECTREGTLLVGSLSNLCRFCNAKQGRMTKRARLRVANQIKQKLNPAGHGHGDF